MEVSPVLTEKPFRSRFSLGFRALSAFIVLSFIAQDFAHAQGGTALWSNVADTKSSTKTDPSLLNTISIPKDAGLTRKAVVKGSDEVIINIQDAHAKLGAQESISTILENLVKNYDLRLVAMEGAEGTVDTSLVSKFPVEEIREKAGRYLLKEGQISAAEFYSMVSASPVTLYGAEDPELYKGNLEAFKSLVESKPAIRAELKSLRQALAALEGRVYSAELRELTSHKLLHKNGEIKFTEYWTKFSSLADRKGVDYRKHANIKKLAAAAELEQEIDFKKAGAERDALIEELGRKLPKPELEKLILESLQFKQNKITPGAFHYYLSQVSQGAGISPASYKNVILYAQYMILFEDIDLIAIFDEVESFESELREMLFKTDDERSLANLAHCAAILSALLDTTLMEKDYRFFVKNSASCEISAVRRELERLWTQYGAGAMPPVDFATLERSIPDAKEFYSLAEARNQALMQNTLKKMRADGSKVAALVTGGFHSEGIAKLMDDEKLSYLVVMPKFDDKSPDRPYLAILTQKPKEYEEQFRNSDYYLAAASFFQSKNPIWSADQTRDVQRAALAGLLASARATLGDIDSVRETFAQALENSDNAGWAASVRAAQIRKQEAGYVVDLDGVRITARFSSDGSLESVESAGETPAEQTVQITATQAELIKSQLKTALDIIEASSKPLTEADQHLIFERAMKGRTKTGAVSASEIKTAADRTGFGARIQAGDYDAIAAMASSAGSAAVKPSAIEILPLTIAASQPRVDAMRFETARAAVEAAETAPIEVRAGPEEAPAIEARRSEGSRMTAAIARTVGAIVLTFALGADLAAQTVRFAVDQAANRVNVLVNEQILPKSMLTGAVYQPTEGRQHISYYNNGRMAELYAPLLPANDPVLKELGLSRRGADHGRILTREMGIQNLRVYYLPLGNAADAEGVKKIFRRAHELYGIRVMAGHWAGLWELPGSPTVVGNNSPQARQAVIESVRRQVREYGQEPWILYWDLGNESNYHIQGGPFTWRQLPMTRAAYYRFMMDLAIAAKQVERELKVRHPVLLGHGSLNRIEALTIAEITKEKSPALGGEAPFDGLAVTMYPGVNFGGRGAQGIFVPKDDSFTGDLSQFDDVMALARDINMPVAIAEIGIWAQGPKDLRQVNYYGAIRPKLTASGWWTFLGAFAATDEAWKPLESGQNRPTEGMFGIIGKAFQFAGGFLNWFTLTGATPVPAAPPQASPQAPVQPAQPLAKPAPAPAPVPVRPPPGGQAIGLPQEEMNNLLVRRTMEGAVPQPNIQAQAYFYNFGSIGNPALRLNRGDTIVIEYTLTGGNDLGVNIRPRMELPGSRGQMRVFTKAGGEKRTLRVPITAPTNDYWQIAFQFGPNAWGRLGEGTNTMQTNLVIHALRVERGPGARLSQLRSSKFFRAAVTLALIIGFPVSAEAAKFVADSSGKLKILVEKGDTAGNILEQIRIAYKAAAPDTYLSSEWFGNFWQVFANLKDSVFGGDVLTRTEITVDLPQAVVNQLTGTPAVETVVQSAAQAVTQTAAVAQPAAEVTHAAVQQMAILPQNPEMLMIATAVIVAASVFGLLANRYRHRVMNAALRVRDAVWLLRNRGKTGGTETADELASLANAQWYRLHYGREAENYLSLSQAERDLVKTVYNEKDLQEFSDTLDRLYRLLLSKDRGGMSESARNSLFAGLRAKVLEIPNLNLPESFYVLERATARWRAESYKLWEGADTVAEPIRERLRQLTAQIYQAQAPLFRRKGLSAYDADVQRVRELIDAASVYALSAELPASELADLARWIETRTGWMFDGSKIQGVSRPESFLLLAKEAGLGPEDFSAASTFKRLRSSRHEVWKKVLLALVIFIQSFTTIGDSVRLAMEAEPVRAPAADVNLTSEAPAPAPPTAVVPSQPQIEMPPAPTPPPFSQAPIDMTPALTAEPAAIPALPMFESLPGAISFYEAFGVKPDAADLSIPDKQVLATLGVLNAVRQTPTAPYTLSTIQGLVQEELKNRGWTDLSEADVRKIEDMVLSSLIPGAAPLVRLFYEAAADQAESVPLASLQNERNDVVGDDANASLQSILRQLRANRGFGNSRFINPYPDEPVDLQPRLDAVVVESNAALTALRDASAELAEARAAVIGKSENPALWKDLFDAYFEASRRGGDWNGRFGFFGNFYGDKLAGYGITPEAAGRYFEALRNYKKAEVEARLEIADAYFELALAERQLAEAERIGASAKTVPARIQYEEYLAELRLRKSGLEARVAEFLRIGDTRGALRTTLEAAEPIGDAVGRVIAGTPQTRDRALESEVWRAMHREEKRFLDDLHVAYDVNFHPGAALQRFVSFNLSAEFTLYSRLRSEARRAGELNEALMAQRVIAEISKLELVAADVERRLSAVAERKTLLETELERLESDADGNAEAILGIRSRLSAVEREEMTGRVLEASAKSDLQGLRRQKQMLENRLSSQFSRQEIQAAKRRVQQTPDLASLKALIASAGEGVSVYDVTEVSREAEKRFIQLAKADLASAGDLNRLAGVVETLDLRVLSEKKVRSLILSRFHSLASGIADAAQLHRAFLLFPENFRAMPSFREQLRRTAATLARNAEREGRSAEFASSLKDLPGWLASDNPHLSRFRSRHKELFPQAVAPASSAATPTPSAQQAPAAPAGDGERERMEQRQKDERRRESLRIFEQTLSASTRVVEDVRFGLKRGNAAEIVAEEAAKVLEAYANHMAQFEEADRGREESRLRRRMATFEMKSAQAVEARSEKREAAPVVRASERLSQNSNLIWKSFVEESPETRRAELENELAEAMSSLASKRDIRIGGGAGLSLEPFVLERLFPAWFFRIQFEKNPAKAEIQGEIERFQKLRSAQGERGLAILAYARFGEFIEAEREFRARNAAAESDASLENRESLIAARARRESALAALSSQTRQEVSRRLAESPEALDELRQIWMDELDELASAGSVEGVQPQDLMIEAMSSLIRIRAAGVKVESGRGQGGIFNFFRGRSGNIFIGPDLGTSAIVSLFSNAMKTGPRPRTAVIERLRQEHGAAVDQLVSELDSRDAAHQALLRDAAIAQALEPGSVNAQVALLPVVQAGLDPAALPELSAEEIEAARKQKEERDLITVRENAGTMRANSRTMALEIQVLEQSAALPARETPEDRVPPHYMRQSQSLGFKAGEATVRLPIDVQINGNGERMLHIGGSLSGADGSTIGATATGIQRRAQDGVLTITRDEVYFTAGGRKVFSTNGRRVGSASFAVTNDDYTIFVDKKLGGDWEVRFSTRQGFDGNETNQSILMLGNRSAQFGLIAQDGSISPLGTFGYDLGGGQFVSGSFRFQEGDLTGGVSATQSFAGGVFTNLTVNRIAGKWAPEASVTRRIENGFWDARVSQFAGQLRGYATFSKDGRDVRLTASSDRAAIEFGSQDFLFRVDDLSRPGDVTVRWNAQSFTRPSWMGRFVAKPAPKPESALTPLDRVGGTTPDARTPSALQTGGLNFAQSAQVPNEALQVFGRTTIERFYQRGDTAHLFNRILLAMGLSGVSNPTDLQHGGFVEAYFGAVNDFLRGGLAVQPDGRTLYFEGHPAASVRTPEDVERYVDEFRRHLENVLALHQKRAPGASHSLYYEIGQRLLSVRMLFTDNDTGKQGNVNLDAIHPDLRPFVDKLLASYTYASRTFENNEHFTAEVLLGVAREIALGPVTVLPGGTVTRDPRPVTDALDAAMRHLRSTVELRTNERFFETLRILNSLQGTSREMLDRVISNSYRRGADIGPQEFLGAVTSDIARSIMLGPFRVGPNGITYTRTAPSDLRTAAAQFLDDRTSAADPAAFAALTQAVRTHPSFPRLLSLVRNADGTAVTAESELGQQIAADLAFDLLRQGREVSDVSRTLEERAALLENAGFLRALEILNTIQNPSLEALIAAEPLLPDETAELRRGRVIGDLARTLALGRFEASPTGFGYRRVVTEVTPESALRFLEETRLIRLHPLRSAVEQAVASSPAFPGLLNRFLTANPALAADPEFRNAVIADTAFAFLFDVNPDGTVRDRAVQSVDSAAVRAFVEGRLFAASEIEKLDGFIQPIRNDFESLFGISPDRTDPVYATLLAGIVSDSGYTDAGRRLNQDPAKVFSELTEVAAMFNREIQHRYPDQWAEMLSQGYIYDASLFNLSLDYVSVRTWDQTRFKPQAEQSETYRGALYSLAGGAIFGEVAYDTQSATFRNIGPTPRNPVPFERTLIPNTGRGNLGWQEYVKNATGNMQTMRLIYEQDPDLFFELVSVLAQTYEVDTKNFMNPFRPADLRNIAAKDPANAQKILSLLGNIANSWTVGEWRYFPSLGEWRLVDVQNEHKGDFTAYLRSVIDVSAEVNRQRRSPLFEEWALAMKQSTGLLNRRPDMKPEASSVLGEQAANAVLGPSFIDPVSVPGQLQFQRGTPYVPGETFLLDLIKGLQQADVIEDSPEFQSLIRQIIDVFGLEGQMAEGQAQSIFRGMVMAQTQIDPIEGEWVQNPSVSYDNLTDEQKIEQIAKIARTLALFDQARDAGYFYRVRDELQAKLAAIDDVRPTAVRRSDEENRTRATVILLSTLNDVANGALTLDRMTGEWERTPRPVLLLRDGQEIPVTADNLEVYFGRVLNVYDILPSVISNPGYPRFVEAVSRATHLADRMQTDPEAARKLNSMIVAFANDLANGMWILNTDTGNWREIPTQTERPRPDAGPEFKPAIDDLQFFSDTLIRTDEVHRRLMSMLPAGFRDTLARASSIRADDPHRENKINAGIGSLAYGLASGSDEAFAYPGGGIQRYSSLQTDAERADFLFRFLAQRMAVYEVIAGLKESGDYSKWMEIIQRDLKSPELPPPAILGQLALRITLGEDIRMIDGGLYVINGWQASRQFSGQSDSISELIYRWNRASGTLETDKLISFVVDMPAVVDGVGYEARFFYDGRFVKPSDNLLAHDPMRVVMMRESKADSRQESENVTGGLFQIDRGRRVGDAHEFSTTKLSAQDLQLNVPVLSSAMSYDRLSQTFTTIAGAPAAASIEMTELNRDDRGNPTTRVLVVTPLDAGNPRESVTASYIGRFGEYIPLDPIFDRQRNITGFTMPDRPLVFLGDEATSFRADTVLGLPVGIPLARLRVEMITQRGLVISIQKLNSDGSDADEPPMYELFATDESRKYALEAIRGENGQVRYAIPEGDAEIGGPAVPARIIDASGFGRGDVVSMTRLVDQSSDRSRRVYDIQRIEGGRPKGDAILQYIDTIENRKFSLGALPGGGFAIPDKPITLGGGVVYSRPLNLETGLGEGDPVSRTEMVSQSPDESRSLYRTEKIQQGRIIGQPMVDVVDSDQVEKYPVTVRGDGSMVISDRALVEGGAAVPARVMNSTTLLGEGSVVGFVQQDIPVTFNGESLTVIRVFEAVPDQASPDGAQPGRLIETVVTGKSGIRGQIRLNDIFIERDGPRRPAGETFLNMTFEESRAWAGSDGYEYDPVTRQSGKEIISFSVEADVPDAWNALSPDVPLQKAVGTFRFNRHPDIRQFEFREIGLFSTVSSFPVATIEQDPDYLNGVNWAINLISRDGPIQNFDSQVIRREMREFNFQSGAVGAMVSDSVKVELSDYLDLSDAPAEVKALLGKSDVNVFLVTDVRRYNKRSLAFFDTPHKENTVATLDAVSIENGEIESGNLNLIRYDNNLFETNRDTYELVGPAGAKHVAGKIFASETSSDMFNLIEQIRTLEPQAYDLIQRNRAKLKIYNVYALMPDQQTRLKRFTFFNLSGRDLLKVDYTFAGAERISAKRYDPADRPWLPRVGIDYHLQIDGDRQTIGVKKAIGVTLDKDPDLGRTTPTLVLDLGNKAFIKEHRHDADDALIMQDDGDFEGENGKGATAEQGIAVIAQIEKLIEARDWTRAKAVADGSFLEIARTWFTYGDVQGRYRESAESGFQNRQYGLTYLRRLNIPLHAVSRLWAPGANGTMGFNFEGSTSRTFSLDMDKPRVDLRVGFLRTGFVDTNQGRQPTHRLIYKDKYGVPTEIWFGNSSERDPNASAEAVVKGFNRQMTLYLFYSPGPLLTNKIAEKSMVTFHRDGQEFVLDRANATTQDEISGTVRYKVQRGINSTPMNASTDMFQRYETLRADVQQGRFRHEAVVNSFVGGIL